MAFTVLQASGVCAQIFDSAFVRERAEGVAADIAKPARMASLTCSGASACMIKCINATLAGKSPRARRVSTSRSATGRAARTGRRSSDDIGERSYSDELTAMIAAIVCTPDVFVRFGSAQEIKFAGARSRAVGDHMGEQKRAGALVREAWIETADICVGAIVILKAIVRGCGLSGDPQFIEPGDRFGIENLDNVGMKPLDPFVGQHPGLITRAPACGVQVDKAVEGALRRAFVREDEMHLASARRASPRLSQVALQVRWQIRFDWYATLKREHRAGAGNLLGNRTRAQRLEAQCCGVGRQFIKRDRGPSGFRRERDRKGLGDEVLPSGLHEHIEKVADCGSERLQMKSARFVLRIEWSNPDQASGIPEREGDRLPRPECAVPR